MRTRNNSRRADETVEMKNGTKAEESQMERQNQKPRRTVSKNANEEKVYTASCRI